MKGKDFSFVLINFVVLFVIVSFIIIVFDLHRLEFLAELVVLLAVISLLTIGIFVVSRNKKWGWTLIGVTMMILLLNLMWIRWITSELGVLYISSVIFSAAGLVISAVNLRHSSNIQPVRDERNREYHTYIDKVEPREEAERQNIGKSFSPGKYIASRQASKFHSPKCDWAKRIATKNQLWFISKEEAESNGYQADKCVS